MKKVSKNGKAVPEKGAMSSKKNPKKNLMANVKKPGVGKKGIMGY